MSEDKKEKKKSSTPVSVKIAFFVLMVTAVLFLPVTIVLAACMIPTLVAALVDAGPQRTAWITVGSLNLAGTFPILVSLWETGVNIKSAIQIVTTTSNLFLPLVGAGAGWVLYNYVTALVAAILVGRSEKRLRDIDKRQKELIRKWGGDVAKG